MPEQVLLNCRILVVEDEYLLADELTRELSDAGALVVGPVGRVQDATNLIVSEPQLDGAVLDVNLGGEMIFPVADLLVERGVPFVLTTGYDALSIPARFGHVVRCEKPFHVHKAIEVIGRAVHRN